jgi:membrane protein implicated in regulation of membrane protease activity
MADPESNDVVAIVTIQEKNKTVRTIVICATILVGLAIAALAVVRIALHVWWAEVIAVLFGPTGIISILLAWYLKRVSRRVTRAEERVKNDLATNSPNSPTGDET